MAYAHPLISTAVKLLASSIDPLVSEAKAPTAWKDGL